MSKQNISASVDEDVAGYLSQEHINASGLINDLVKQYMDGGSEQAAILRLREEQLRSEIEALSQQEEAKRQELNRLADSRKEAEQSPSYREDLLELLRTIEEDDTHIWPAHNTIKELAKQENKPAGEVIDDAREIAAEERLSLLTTQFVRAGNAKYIDKEPITEAYTDE